jgi:hypothetical protein
MAAQVLRFYYLKPGWKGGNTFAKAPPPHGDPFSSAQIRDPSRASNILLNYSGICKIKKEGGWG